ncbi:MAG: hypothetical protein AAF928_04275 [Myxococcota bacterium]
MTDERMGLEDLEDDERLAFGALLRAMVSMDGTYSPEERAVFKVLADDLGAEAFWAMVKQAAEVRDPAEILALAKKVERAPARELIYYGVNATAQAGDVAASEAALLTELRTMWGLEAPADDARADN